MVDTAVQSGHPETETAGNRRLFGRLRDRIAASDPAFSRLRMASRAMLSLLLSLALLGGVTLIQPLPIAAYGMAVLVSFLGSMAITDKTATVQLASRALLESRTLDGRTLELSYRPILHVSAGSAEGPLTR